MQQILKVDNNSQYELGQLFNDNAKSHYYKKSQQLD